MLSQKIAFYCNYVQEQTDLIIKFMHFEDNNSKDTVTVRLTPW
jgi:hypothetical protein